MWQFRYASAPLLLHVLPQLEARDDAVDVAKRSSGSGAEEAVCSVGHRRRMQVPEVHRSTGPRPTDGQGRGPFLLDAFEDRVWLVSPGGGQGLSLSGPASNVVERSSMCEAFWRQLAQDQQRTAAR